MLGSELLDSISQCIECRTRSWQAWPATLSRNLWKPSHVCCVGTTEHMSLRDSELDERGLPPQYSRETSLNQSSPFTCRLVPVLSKLLSVLRAWPTSSSCRNERRTPIDQPQSYSLDPRSVPCCRYCWYAAKHASCFWQTWHTSMAEWRASRQRGHDKKVPDNLYFPVHQNGGEHRLQRTSDIMLTSTISAMITASTRASSTSAMLAKRSCGGLW